MQNLMNFINSDRINLLVLFLLLYYVFQGFFVKIGISSSAYIVTMILYVVVLFRRKCNLLNRSLRGFILGGLLTAFFSVFFILNNALIVIPAALFMTFFHYYLWMLIFETNDEKKLFRMLDVYFAFIIVVAAISGLLALYQIFIDSSIWGLAINKIYGSVELMESGNFKSRATALLGSAQNYGCFMGVSFCIGIFRRFKNQYVWILCMVCILIGAIISNSRSASSSVIIGLTLGIFFYNKMHKIGDADLILYTISIVIVVCIAASVVVDYDLEKYSRVLNFNNQSARNVYKETYDSTDLIASIFGHGFGYRNYSLNQLLGEDMYRESFGSMYMSCESYFLTLWSQGGVFLLFPIVRIMLKVLSISYKHKTIPIILCIFINMLFTPSMSSLAISFLLWPVLFIELRSKDAKTYTYA